jgi:methylglutamate dehydrogenase subunit D
MEHLGTILLREADDRFLLMSASSSARSFLHGLETSLRNVA